MIGGIPFNPHKESGAWVSHQMTVQVKMQLRGPVGAGMKSNDSWEIVSLSRLLIRIGFPHFFLQSIQMYNQEKEELIILMSQKGGS
jgi:hypothetical protein